MGMDMVIGIDIDMGMEAWVERDTGTDTGV